MRACFDSQRAGQPRRLMNARSVAALGLLALAAPLRAHGVLETGARIDHVILGAADLDRGVAVFERMTGVRPVYGGKHPGGTHTALVSLGGRTYLEIVAVEPGAAPPKSLPDLTGYET